MKKTDVMRSFSAARGACEMVTWLLRGTANRVADRPEERGPDPDHPYLIPLTREEKRAKIMEAWWYSRLLLAKAQTAHRNLDDFAAQNGITADQLDAYGKRKEFVS